LHFVNPKKSLGQHFLKDNNIANKIVDSLDNKSKNVLEIGPGTGILTKFLINKKHNLKLVEIDKESVSFLISQMSIDKNIIIENDFLKLDLYKVFNGEKFSIIGNFPYNISSQIVFKILENRNIINEMSGMFQYEVAERICEPEGSKKYGILSVLTQAFFDVELLFEVSNHLFIPPPKVKSAVILLKRKELIDLECDEDLFFKIVKLSFQQRRKTIRNSLKKINLSNNLREDSIFDYRPEQLSVNQFIKLTKLAQGDLKM
tara:strand:+ start:470 stop:1249 length:780 start_codon:yes stop_codon:yes gene_type:complete